MESKRNLTSELQSVVKSALKEGGQEPLSSDVVSAICNVTDAIFIHGLRDPFFVKGSRYAKYPEPNFWPFVSKFAHRNVNNQIKNLKQIRCEVGKARAWVRITLNERDMGHYLTAISREPQAVRQFYHKYAFLRDAEQIEMLIDYMKGLSKVKIAAPVNSSFLNTWTPTPLDLAGLLSKSNHGASGRISAVPQMEGILEEDCAVGQSAVDYFNVSDTDSSGSAPLANNSHSPFVIGSPYGHMTPHGSSVNSDISHLSIFDQRFAEIMRNLVNDKQSEGSAPAGDEELVDSGIGSEPGVRNDVVVHRTSNFARAGSGRGRRKRSSAERSDRRSNPHSASNSPRPSSPERAEISVQTLAEELLEAEAETEATTTISIQTISHANEQITETLIEQEKESVEESFTTAFESDSHSVESPDIPTPDPARCMPVPNLDMSYSPGNSLKSRGWSCSDFEESILAKYDDSRLIASSFSSVLKSALNQSVLQHQEQEAYAEGGAADKTDSTGLQFTEQINEKEIEIGHAPMTEDTDDGAMGPAIAGQRDKSPEDFVVIERSDVSPSDSGPADTFSQHKEYLWRTANENGLDAQNFQCLTCKRYIGLDFTYGAFRVCALDGCYYCTECHRNDEMLMPSRLIQSWDLTPRKVCRASKAFLDHVADRPLIHLDQVNPTLYDFAAEMKETMNLRHKLSLVAMYLLTCKESVAEDLRKRMWPREYLYNDVHLYSVNDLIGASRGALQKYLRGVIDFATAHVNGCRLCVQKGFICEICNHKNIIYPFQVETTTRCEKCFSVYHSSCIHSRPCPKCVRRESYARERRTSDVADDLMNSIGLEES